MNDIKRPLPNLEERDTEDFWAATLDHELHFQQCSHCDTIVFYPRSHCTGCTEGELISKVASGMGTVYTYSIIRQSYHPFFRNLIPYVVAWIDLDEGPRLLSNVIDTDGQAVHIGMRVQISWETHEGVNLPLFKAAQD